MLAILAAAPVAVLAQAFNPITAFAPLAGSVLRQTNANSFAGKSTMATGVATVVFQVPYIVTPVCTGTEEGVTTRYAVISAISTTGVTFTASVTAGNSDVLDWACVGNPN